MKKHLSLLIVALLALFPAHAFDFSAVAPSGQTLYYTITGTNTVSLTSQNASYPYYTTAPTGSLIIPATVTYDSLAYSVTMIGDNTFCYCTGLTSVVIPSSVTSLGSGSFYGCTGLTALTIPSSVTTIGTSAFLGAGLMALSIPTSIISIGTSAFRNCRSLSAVTFNAINCTSMGGYYAPVFQDCSSLSSLIIGDSVQTIPPYAFYDCDYLTALAIPPSVTSVGDNAFHGCNRLATIAISNSVTTIGNYAFYNCTALTALAIPPSVTTIGTSAFHNCGGITALTLGCSVTSIGNYAFRNCTGLTDLTIPDSVTSVGKGAFYGCTGLTTLTVGSSVTTIGEQTFYGCSALMEITSLALIAPTLGAEAFCNVSDTIPVTIPCSRDASYYGTRWSHFSNFIEGSGYAFTADSEDSTKGSIALLVAPSCLHPTAVVEAIPAIGYHFSSWDDGDTANPRTIILMQDTALTARFAADTFHVEVRSNDLMRGGVTGTGNYWYSQMVTATATAYSGYVFDKWSNASTDNPYTFAASENLTLTAIFIPEDSVGFSFPIISPTTITTSGTQITVSGAANQPIRLFDAMGRLLGTSTIPEEPHIFNLPATGVYLIQIGNSPVHRVVLAK